MGKYDRNMNTLSKEENESLKNFKICVVGCGGIGGYVIEMLGRLGIGYITVIDGDVFEKTNLNRQILSNSQTIGKSKAQTARERMKLVNPDIYVNAVFSHLNGENGMELIKDHNLVIDALDDVETRFILQDICEKLGLPLIHGAIAGWYGQVTTIFPGDKTLDFLYKKRTTKGIERKLGNPSFAPALIGSIQVSEALKVLIGRGEVLRKKILYIDTFAQEYEIVEFF